MNRAPILCAAVLTAMASQPASADVESWTWFELRQPLKATSSDNPFLPDRLRLFTDTRIGLRYPGLGNQFVRVGPIWHLHPHLFLATHLTALADQIQPGVFDQEYRLEFEPNVIWRWGDFSFADRNRLEYRWRPSGQRFRYRNQLRVNFQPDGASVYPFLWDEVLIDLSGLGFNQNRAVLGVAFDLGEGRRLDVGYGLRSRQLTTGPWDHDHLLNLSFFTAPPARP